MSFTEWYEHIYKEKWTDNHAPLNSLLDEYEEYCEKSGIVPVWNG